MSYVRIRAVVVMIVWLLDLQLPLKSVPINTNVVSSNSAYGEVYSIRHYVIMFVSYLRQISDFLLVLWFPQHNWNIVESVIKHHNPTHMYGSIYGIGATIIFNGSV